MGLFDLLKKKPRTSSRTDGWQNALTGLGTKTHDKREHSSFQIDILSQGISEQLWRGDDLAARCIEKLPDEMTREGFTLSLQINGEGQPKLEEQVLELWDELNVIGNIEKGLQYERAYGGGALYLSVKDTNMAFYEPLDPQRVLSFHQIIPLEPDEVYPHYFQNNLSLPRYGEPLIYQLNPISPGPGEDELQGTQFIHESRIIPFPGIVVSRRQNTHNQWGDSVLNRVYRVLRDFNMSWDAAGVLVQEFAQAVIKIQGLAELMALDKDNIVKKRIEAIQLSKSVLRAILMDAEEEYERHQTPLSGLPDVLRLFMIRLATAVDMPLTVLFGISPAGLNATGESDLELWYNRVEAKQRKRIVPILKRITQLILALLGASENIKIKIEPNPLWQESDKEKAESRKTQADADAIYLDRYVVSPEEIAENRFGGGAYSHETIINMKDRIMPSAPEETEDEDTKAVPADNDND